MATVLPQSVLSEEDGEPYPNWHVETAALITHDEASSGVNGTDQLNRRGRGVVVAIDISAISGVGASLTVTIEGKDPVSGNYYTLLASAAIEGTGTTTLSVYPGLTAAANSVANAVLPRSWRVISAIAGTVPSVTATVSACILQ